MLDANLIIKPIMKYFNYSNIEEALKGSGFSPLLKNGIDSFLKDGTLAIEQDMHEEGKERVCLVQAKNFNKFARANQEDFEAFGKFLAEYQSAYAYEWSHFYAVAQCILMFKVKMPGKVRLLEMTGHDEWAFYALENDSICNYIIKNFALYANMSERFLDDNGEDVLPILEIFYHKLLKKSYPEGSVQHLLRNTIYQYLFSDLTTDLIHGKTRCKQV